MTSRPPTTPPGDPKRSADDFAWPPDGDDLSIYEVEADSWRDPQDASTEAFAARDGGLPPPRQSRPARRLAGVIAALALVAAAAGWMLYRATSTPRTVEAGDRPPVAAAPPAAPAAAPSPAEPGRDGTPFDRRPDVTIIATYPVEPAATAATGPEASATAAAPLAPEAAADLPAPDLPAPRPATATAAPVDALPPTLATPPAPDTAERVAASVALPSPPAAPASTADAGIRHLLQRYEDAYDQRDVQTAAALWPSLDRRALTRAFASLDRQDVSFDRCDIDASADRGSAVCVGTVRYVPSVGRGVEKEGRITWTFDVTRSGEDWRITRLRAR